MIIENLIGLATDAEPSFYRTSGGAEIDLVLTWRDGREWAVEVKRTLFPKVERGMRSALADVEPDRAFVVYPGEERFALGAGVEAIGPAELCAELSSKSGSA